MTREKALEIIEKRVKNKNSIKHMLATEAIMKALAEHFGKNKETWGLAGLCHDLDMEDEECLADPSQHANRSAQDLEAMGVEKEITEAIRAHNPQSGKTPETLIEKCLYATDPLTGLIVASTLVLPSKKIADLKLESLLKRFKENRFAAGARREGIAACSNFDMDLEDFLAIGLRAMQGIAEDLGL
jgi:hypothetical protein